MDGLASHDTHGVHYSTQFIYIHLLSILITSSGSQCLYRCLIKRSGVRVLQPYQCHIQKAKRACPSALWTYKLISQPAPLLQGRQQPSQGGMSHHISPSQIRSKSHCQSSDWWQLSTAHSSISQGRQLKRSIGKPSRKSWVSCEASCHRTLWMLKLYTGTNGLG